MVYQMMHSNVTPGYMALALFSVCNWLQDVILVCLSSEDLVAVVDLLNSYTGFWSFTT